MMHTEYNAGLWKAPLSVVIALLVLAVGPAYGQGWGGPLNIQGVNQQHNHSAAARAFGGVTMQAQGNVGLLFVNPASIQGIDGIQISIAGSRLYQDLEQVQQFAPVRYYPNLSLLLEGLTDDIPDPDPDLIGFTPADSVQRPFDDIRPNWTHSNNSSIPLHAVVAVPFSLGGLQVTAGLGAIQYANLDHYYQNNNVLNPPVLSARPLPVLRPTDDDPLTVDWYQSVRSRDGYINGYGAAFAGHLASINLTIGISALLLSGESDDFESRLERGRLTFLSNEFRADSSVGYATRTGTSSFSGAELAVSGRLTGSYVDLGFVAKPPTRITRSFDLQEEGADGTTATTDDG